MLLDTRFDLTRSTLLAIVAVAAVLRVLAAMDTFSLDEIWTYYLVRDAEGPWHIIAGLPHTNNHILNSLFVRLMGEQPHWIAYRLLSLITGTATIWLIGFIAADYGVPARFFTMGLATISLPLVLYSAEARGYAPLLCFSLFAYLNSPERVDDPSVRQIATFWIASLLALLSHLTFAIVLAGLGLSWLIARLRSKTSAFAMLREGTTYFAVPVAICVLLLVHIYSNVRPETGGQMHPLVAATEMALLSLGIDTSGIFEWLGSGAALLLLLGGLWLAGKRMTNLLLIMIVVPAAIFTVIDAPYVFPRYFLVLVPFFLLTVSISLQYLWDRAVPYRVLALGIFATAVIGAATQLTELYQYGKGDYPAAIAQIFSVADGRPFTVGSDHDFRNRALLEFYTRYEPAARQMTYVNKSSLLSNPPNFYIKHSFEKSAKAPPHIALGESAVYEIIGEYPFSGHSGWNWWIYRKF